MLRGEATAITKMTWSGAGTQNGYKIEINLLISFHPKP